MLCIGLALHVALALRPEGVVQTGRLPDTDAYARTLRVERLATTGDWHDSSLPQLNAPGGLSLHWTRPLDVLILGPALAATAVGVELRSAIFWTGAALPPLVHLLCAFAAAWAARAVWPGPAAWAAAGAILLNPVIGFAYGAFGQTDHHILVLLAALLALGAGLRAIRDPTLPRPALAAGVALGIGLWVSPEMLLLAVPILAAFAAAWVLRSGSPGADAARQGSRVALAMLSTAVLALAIERPPADWLNGDYDKLSAQHVMIAGLAAAAFAVLTAAPARLARPLRLALGLAIAAMGAAVLLAVYPGALRASEAAADPDVATLFLPHVAEMQALRLAGDGAQDLLLYAGGLVAVVVLPLLLRQGRWPGALMLALAIATTGAATLLHRRFGIDLAAATALAAPGFVVLANRIRAPLLRAPALAAAMLLAIAAPYAGLAFPANDSRQREARACDWAGLAAWMAAAPLPAEPAPIILTDSWRPTPELAWRTPYRFIVSPYHRAGDAFRDTAEVMRATDDGAARAILARRGATHVLLCTAVRPVWLGNAEPRQLLARLSADTPPDWLTPLALPATLPAFRLLRIAP
jgi:hypothetical protein